MKGCVNSFAEYPEDDWLALSGIQHYLFCPRQWALIHIEQLWTENYLTTAGKLEHKKAHDYSTSEKRGDSLTLRDLRVFSRTLGITGACDVVEFHASPDGVKLQQREGLWSPFPVEYKHGKPKDNDADRVQLCAEAMCLEEMLKTTISRGSLFYHETRRREEVELDDDLRHTVCKALTEMHQLMKKGHTPKVRKRRVCASCSLKDVCLPELDKVRTTQVYIEKMLDEE